MDDVELYGYLTGRRSPASWDFQFQQKLCSAILVRDEQAITEILRIVDHRAETAHSATGYDTRWWLLLKDLGQALAATYSNSERDRRLLVQVSEIQLTRSGDLPFDHYKRKKYVGLLGADAADFLISLLERYPTNFFIVESLVHTADRRAAAFLVNVLSLPTKTPYIKCRYMDWISEDPSIADAFTLIEPCVDDRDSLIRKHSLGVLSRLDPIRAQPIALELLTDHSAEVRQFAVKTLEDMRDLSGVSLIAERLAIDASEEVRIEAARTLGILGPVIAPPELVAGLRDSSNDVRGMSAWALGQIGDKSALDVLKECQHDSSELTSWSINSAIQVLESR